jgi:UDP-N-acetylglucosamine 2-epimerase (non-hydrolysing)
MLKILVVFGTRPEAIKLAPIIQLLKKDAHFNIKICVTAQHRQMLDQVLELFSITPDYDLDIMLNNQSLTGITCAVLKALEPVLQDFKPQAIMVHGDTTTTFSSALAAYYQKIPVLHIEAGLRTGNIYAPYPEEINRKLTANITALHFAPTYNAKQNLLNEGVSESKIFVTGNTVIDALLYAVHKIETNNEISYALNTQFNFINPQKKLILITAHRRENFGSGFEQICEMIKLLSHRNDLEIVYPVHLNPYVQKIVFETLNNISNIHLIKPLDYLPFVYLMKQAYLILTDSGGVQEEAPTLGKPVLVMRETTERPEAIEQGTALLVGTNVEKTVQTCFELIDNVEIYQCHCIKKENNLYGDGKSSQRIISILKNFNFI